MLTRLAIALTLFVVAFDSPAAITGFALDQEGRPVANATVNLFRRETPDERFARMLAMKPREVLGETKSGDDGSFLLDAEKSRGPHVLQVSAFGFLPAGAGVEDGEFVGGVLLTRSEIRRGKVTAAGKPVADAVIYIAYGGGETTMTTDARGRFAAPWEYGSVEGVRYMAVIHPDHPLHIVSGSVRSLDVVIPGSTPLRGRVVASDGETAVAGATIRVDGWLLAQSGEDGTWSAERAPARWSQVSAEHAEGIAIHNGSSGPPAVLRLQPGVVVHGSVIDAASKRPIPDAFVSVPSPGPGGLIRADANGRYSTRVLEAHMVYASHPGFVSESITVGEGGETEVALDRIARISGTVVSEDGEPVAGALISALPDSPPHGRLHVLPPVRSGGDGRFVLSIVPDQPQTIEAEALARPTVRSATVTLAAGARRDIRLEIPTGIEVTGRVSDADGNPLVGVAVSTERETSSSVRHMNQAAGILRTSANGTYALRLTEGSYTFSFSGDSVVAKSLRGQRISSATPNVIDVTLEQSFAIEGRVMRGGENVGGVMVELDDYDDPPRAHTDEEGRFTLRGLNRGKHWVVASHRLVDHRIQLSAPASDIVIELPEGGTIVGRVVDRQNGAAIPSFRAGFAINRSGPTRSTSASAQWVPFDTDDGTFRLEHVPSGVTDIVAEAPGYVQGRLKVRVEDGKEGTVTLGLERGARLTGRVTAESGSPLADVTVTLRPVLRHGGSWQDRKARSDAGGMFTFEGLARDEWSLTFEHRDFASLVQQVVVRDQETRQDFVLARGNEVSGIVVATSGEPLSGALVTIFNPNTQQSGVRTGQDGRFAIPNVPEGRYQLRVENHGFVALMNLIEVPDASLRLELRRGATIRGRIVGLAADQLANVDVNVMARFGNAKASVGPDATYVVEAAPVGEVRIRAATRGEKNHRVSNWTTLQLREGESLQHDIVFASGFAVEGVVLLNQEPLAAARVTLVDHESSAAFSTVADSTGAFRIADLHPGRYDIEVLDRESFGGFTTHVDLTGPQSLRLAFTAHDIRGRIVDAITWEPVPNASIRLQSVSNRDGRSIGTQTGLDGKFIYQSVPPGAWQIRVEKDGYETGIVQLQVEAQAVPVEVRMKKVVPE